MHFYNGKLVKSEVLSTCPTFFFKTKQHILPCTFISGMISYISKQVNIQTSETCTRRLNINWKILGGTTPLSTMTSLRTSMLTTRKDRTGHDRGGDLFYQILQPGAVGFLELVQKFTHRTGLLYTDNYTYSILLSYRIKFRNQSWKVRQSIVSKITGD